MAQNRGTRKYIFFFSLTAHILNFYCVLYIVNVAFEEFEGIAPNAIKR